MNTLTNYTLMTRDFSNKNLQNATFREEDLAEADFSGSDLRGANFSGADLSEANLSQARTGMTTINVVWLFIAALAVSLISGYVAMLTGRTLHTMLISDNPHVRNAGILSSVLIILFILYGYWKGGGKAIMTLIVPAIITALAIGVIINISGLGTGRAMLYLILSLLLIVVMFIIGTVARAAAGSLSNILFLVVALSGGMFGRSLGGGIGTVIMAIACMQISKRALSGAKGFDFLRKVASSITRKYGTSFRKTKLTGANFCKAKLHNADFTGADVTSVNWGDIKKINCITSEGQFTAK